MITNKEIEKVIDHLSGETPERLALIFSKKEVALMEKNFQKRLTITQK